MTARRIDITGNRYGRLVAIEPTPLIKNKAVVWQFLCDCGNEVLRDTSQLSSSIKRGHEQSCGCIKNIKINSGDTFEKLTAIREIGKSSRGFIWEFSCECGKLTEKNLSQVVRGQGALHCGCSPKKGKDGIFNLTNQIFGNFKVLSFAGPNDKNQTTWNCECINCGKNEIVKGYYLRRIKRCICEKELRGKWAYRGIGDLYRSHWTSIKSGAKSRKLSFTIDIEYAWELFLKQDKKCALTGWDIILGNINKTASLDRIDSSRGYDKDNIQWVHKNVNRLKMDFSQDDFIELCKAVAKNKS